jgi:hypothetical protein
MSTAPVRFGHSQVVWNKGIRGLIAKQWREEGRLREEGAMVSRQLSEPKLVEYLGNVMMALSVPKASM